MRRFIPIRPAHRLILIFLAALAWRCLMLPLYRMIDTDAAYYGHIARLFAGGYWERALDPIWPPLYPFLVSIPLRLGVPLEASGLAISMLASAGCVIWCYYLATFIAHERVGIIAALVAAFHPRLVFFSQSILTEALYLFLSAAALTLFVYVLRDAGSGISKRNAAGFFLAGAGVAAAFLTRPEGLLLFIIFLAIAIGQAAINAAGKRRARAKTALLLPPLLLVLGFGILAAPYLHSISRTQGRLIPGEKGALNFYLTYADEYRDEGIEIEPSDYAAITGTGHDRQPGRYRVVEFVRRRPGLVAMQTLKNLPRALLEKIPSLMYWPLMLLSLTGLVYRRSIPRSRYEILFGVWIVSIALLVSPLFLLRRFFIAALPPLIVWCAIGIEELRARIGRIVFIAGAGALLLLFCCYTPYSLAGISWPVLYKEAGRWVREHESESITFTGRKPEPSFYADAGFTPLEAGDIDALKAFLAKEDITHLVVEDYIMPRSHPGLVHLLDTRKAPPWLDPVFSGTDGSHTLIVYRYVHD